jgi:hypothetical protein
MLSTEYVKNREYVEWWAQNMLKGWRMYSKMTKVERPRGRQCIGKLAEILVEKGSKLKSNRIAGDG